MRHIKVHINFLLLLSLSPLCWGNNAHHIVLKKGDTLSKIAKKYHITIKQLKALNNIKNPSKLQVGQKIILVKHDNEQKKHNVIKWQWPIHGPVKKNKNHKTINNGIDIMTKFDQPVRATTDGIVIYQGFHIRDYGGLVILKHKNNFISAYGYNRETLVSEGEKVLQGQIIAKSGRDKQGNNLSHFEIRHHGKPIQPINLLK